MQHGMPRGRTHLPQGRRCTLDVTLRKPKTKGKVDPRQLPLTYTEFVAGWRGWRWLLCDDNTWHLVSAIYKARVVDTQCAGDLRIVEQVNPNNLPMCKSCCDVQAARWAKGPPAQNH